MNAKVIRVLNAYLKNSYDYSSVQFELSKDIAEEILDWGYENIPESILAGDGFEEDKHITIKYGIHINDFTKVRDLFINKKPITAVLGKISLFYPDEPYDVIKIDVISPELRQLNKEISQRLEHTDTHSTYKPHVTIAYIKKGNGKSFEGNDIFEGKRVKLDTVLFSGKDNREVMFKIPH